MPWRHQFARKFFVRRRQASSGDRIADFKLGDRLFDKMDERLHRAPADCEQITGLSIDVDLFNGTNQTPSGLLD